MSEFPEFDLENAEVEVIEHDEPETERSLARRIALQALYEVDSAHHNVDEVVARHVLAHKDAARKVRSYLSELVVGVINNQGRLDRVIRHYAPEFPLEQVAIIDRNILRMAIYEFGIASKVPVGVAIDEAVELAKLFGADNTHRFINGVLGTLADNEESLRTMLEAGEDKKS
ncbi:MAG: transcription antitermination factor NusB [Anaerolineae bacterium]